MSASMFSQMSTSDFALRMRLQAVAWYGSTWGLPLQVAITIVT